MIAHPDGHRDQVARNRRVKAVAYVLSGVLAGLALGLVLGLIGSRIEVPAAATAVALTAVVLGVLQLIGVRIPVLHRDTETPRGWSRLGPVRWAIVNGASLGVGFTTRIGFWAWYLVPAFALLVHGTIPGAAVYGSYALTRTVAAPIVLSAAARHPDWDFSRAMIRASYRARWIAALVLIGAGCAFLTGG